MKNSLIVMDSDKTDLVYGPEQIREIASLTALQADPVPPEQLTEQPELLSEVEIIFSGWGLGTVDEKFLANAPCLKAIHHGAGSVRSIATTEMFERGVVLTSAWKENAVPVAEFTFARIILGLKSATRIEAQLLESRDWHGERRKAESMPGSYRSTVGLVSLGAIGRRVLEFLKMTDIAALVHDIPGTEDAIIAAGGIPTGLDDLFRTCDVVSLHTALLPETRGMISGAHIRSMKPGAVFLNTARGGLIRQVEMLSALAVRKDLTVFLDVVDPEPPPPDSELFTLPNVHVTPHIAGSLGVECRRLGQSAIDECHRRLSGQPLRNEVTPGMLETMA